VTQSLRVGFDARWYNQSGVGSYVTGLLTAIALRREIELLVYENPENPVPGLKDLPITRIAVYSPRYSLRAQWELRRRTAIDGLHLLHSPFYDIPYGLRCPVVVTIHDLIPFLYRIYTRPKQDMVKAGYRLAVRKAAHIIAVSENTARDLQSLLHVRQDRITIVHNAAARQYSHSAPSPNEAEILASRYGVRQPYIVAGSAGNWETKNLSSALGSLEEATDAGVKFQSVVFGPPEGLQACGGKARWPKLELNYIGVLPPTMLASLFRNAMAFVMPSLYEGFGLPLIEAMSCGCPVVTSNRSAIPEIAGAGAQLFDPMDYVGMGRALAKLLGDSSIRRQWKEKALRRAADFSWEKAARETIAVYRANSEIPNGHSLSSRGTA
jgi:glycosyltransferase involved in cell wall biosynthesis